MTGSKSREMHERYVKDQDIEALKCSRSQRFLVSQLLRLHFHCCFSSSQASGLLKHDPLNRSLTGSWFTNLAGYGNLGGSYAFLREAGLCMCLWSQRTRQCRSMLFNRHQHRRYLCLSIESAPGGKASSLTVFSGNCLTSNIRCQQLLVGVV